MSSDQPQMVVSPKNVARVVGKGGYWSRKEIAEFMNRDKTTHVINTIEKAVSMGLINRIAGQDDHGRSTFIYTIETKQIGLGE